MGDIGGIVAGKKILIMGLRNKWGIAWGITKKLYDEGAELAFTYMGEREEQGVRDLLKSLADRDGEAGNTVGVSRLQGGDFPLFKCDLGDDGEIDAAFAALGAQWGRLDGVVHAIANARTEDLQNDFIMTSREGFAHALNISAYTLVYVSRKASELMTTGKGDKGGGGSDGSGGNSGDISNGGSSGGSSGGGGSILTLTYMGSERVFPGYNVMGVAKAALEATVRYLAHNLGPSGIRVNAISSGPIKTLSSKAVKNFSSIMSVVDEKAPLKRGVSADEIGSSALYLLSDLSSAVTGEIHYVDCGFNIMGT